jgi:hypothetical protein
MSRLKYVSDTVADSLWTDVAANVARYQSGNFLDMLSENDWSIELKLDVDLSPLSQLDPAGTADAEIANSKLVWKALSKLPPSLAHEQGIWVRLTHVECLEYSRARWLSGLTQANEIEASVVKHFFAGTLTGRRDDNAISRLWWNARVADTAMPNTNLSAMDDFLRKADFRLNFIERSETVSRPVLASGVVRAMRTHAWITAREDNFRAFMRRLNFLGGGVVFEAMSPADVDNFMKLCAERAGMENEPTQDDTPPMAAVGA